MRCVVGIDLGSTTTKAVLLDASGELLGRGITNSRSNYAVACAVAREETHAAARFQLLRRGLEATPGLRPSELPELLGRLQEAVRLERYLTDLAALRESILRPLASPLRLAADAALADGAGAVLGEMAERAPALFASGAPRRSDFFRDLAAESFMAAAERVAARGDAPFERLVALFDRAILAVETEVRTRDFCALLGRAADRALPADLDPGIRVRIFAQVRRAGEERIEEVATAGTGYGRQTLPFPREAVRSEILCHGRGAHHVFPGTHTVLDIGGQDTKAIQVDERGLVSSFQMNDRCAAGCGRYLGYIADELNLGLHELGPLALQARRVVKVSSTCTVFAGAELRERLALGERREDILAGLHRSIMLRAMSLLARSGGIRSELTFTGGVCNNAMATRVLRELVDQHYGGGITINMHPDSIYMGALGAALFALDDMHAGRPGLLPSFAAVPGAPQAPPEGGGRCALS
jgi:benzoyl-CoA reductase subunit A